MKTFTILMAIVSISILLQTCKKESGKIIPTDDYLPLEVGNYWQLDYTNKEEIIGTKTIDNKTYFILVSLNDTTYLRKENGKIYAIENMTGESIKFDLSANVHDTWKYNLYNVTLISKTDSITINNQKIYNCYQFYFDVPVWVDEEQSIWLAPGLGFIQESCGECIHQIRKLDNARIGGQNIDY